MSVTQDIATKTIDFYFLKMRAPTLEELGISESSVMEKGCAFVTLYLNGEVHGSAGNIKEITPTLGEEIITNTIEALSKDTRFTPMTASDADKIRSRVDVISSRDIISLDTLKSLDPTKHGVIAIHRDYEDLGVILPNISPKLMTGDDFLPVLQNKMGGTPLNETDFILYKIETQTETNF